MARGSKTGAGGRSGGGAGGASAGAVRAGAAFVELFAKDQQLADGLAKASAKVKEWSVSIAKIVAAGVAGAGAAFAVGVGHFVTKGDSIKKASDRLGIGAETLSALGYAASQSGSDLEGLEKGLRKLQQNIYEGANGSAEMADSFRTLGLEVDSLLNMKPEDQWLRVADALSDVENVTERNALAMKAFGKTGTELIPLLLGGSKGVRSLMEEAHRTGSVVTQEQAEAAERIGDSFERVWAAIKGAIFKVGASLATVVNQIETLSQFTVDLIGHFVEWAGKAADIGNIFGDMKGEWEAFTDAVAANDVGLSMEIAGMVMEKAWDKSLESMRDKFKEWQKDLQTDLAKWMADPSIAGTKLADLKFFQWMDPDSMLDPKLRATDEERKALQDEIERGRNAVPVVDDAEKARRAARDAEWEKQMDELRKRAAAGAPDKRNFGGFDFNVEGALKQAMGTSTKGAFNFASPSQFFGGGNPIQDLKKLTEEQNGLVRELLVALRGVPLARL